MDPLKTLGELSWDVLIVNILEMNSELFGKLLPGNLTLLTRWEKKKNLFDSHIIRLILVVFQHSGDNK